MLKLLIDLAFALVERTAVRPQGVTHLRAASETPAMPNVVPSAKGVRMDLHDDREFPSQVVMAEPGRPEFPGASSRCGSGDADGRMPAVHGLCQAPALVSRRAMEQRDDVPQGLPPASWNQAQPAPASALNPDRIVVTACALSLVALAVLHFFGLLPGGAT